MTKVIETLRREHDSMSHVLDVLESEIGYLLEYERDEKPDFDLVWRAVDYFTDFPDLIHHPKEDMIFERLRKVDPVSARQVGDLPGAHKTLARELGDLSHELKTIMDNPHLPHGPLTAKARDFVRHQREHLEREESQFFPIADHKLSAADWSALRDQMMTRVDPLIDGVANERFEALQRIIVNGLKEREQTKTR